MHARYQEAVHLGQQALADDLPMPALELPPIFGTAEYLQVRPAAACSHTARASIPLAMHRASQARAGRWLLRRPLSQMLRHQQHLQRRRQHARANQASSQQHQQLRQSRRCLRSSP